MSLKEGKRIYKKTNYGLINGQSQVDISIISKIRTPGVGSRFNRLGNSPLEKPAKSE